MGCPAMAFIEVYPENFKSLLPSICEFSEKDLVEQQFCCSLWNFGGMEWIGTTK
jgi:hypothetical protein